MSRFINITDHERRTLIELGTRLRAARLQRDETQAVFSARVGISRSTYVKMESGDPAIGIGYWVRAIDLLGRLGDFSRVLEARESLFETFAEAQRPRQRASRRP